MQTAAGPARATRPGSPGLSQPRVHELCLDLTVFDALAGVLDPPVLAQVYREFLLQTRSRVEELRSKPNYGNRPALAHTIKGTAGMLGARAIAGHAERLESGQGEGETAKTLAAMLTACAALDAALRERRILP